MVELDFFFKKDEEPATFLINQITNTLSVLIYSGTLINLNSILFIKSLKERSYNKEDFQYTLVIHTSTSAEPVKISSTDLNFLSSIYKTIQDYYQGRVFSTDMTCIVIPPHEKIEAAVDNEIEMDYVNPNTYL